MSTRVSSRIIVDSRALTVLDRAQMEALSLTGDAVMTELKNAEVMPFKTGSMQNDNTDIDDSKRMSGTVSIVTSAPQVRRLYYHPEYNFTKKYNTSAGGKWAERFKTQRPVEEIYAEQFKRLGGL